MSGVTVLSCTRSSSDSTTGARRIRSFTTRTRLVCVQKCVASRYSRESDDAWTTAIDKSLTSKGFAGARTVLVRADMIGASISNCQTTPDRQGIESCGRHLVGPSSRV